MKFKIGNKIQLVNLTLSEWKQLHPTFNVDGFGDLYNHYMAKNNTVKASITHIHKDNRFSFPISVQIEGTKGSFLVTPLEIKLINQKQKLYKR